MNHVDHLADPTEVLVDTHVHTRYSDGTASIDQIVRHCRARSVGLCVTDHNEIRGSVALCERDGVATIPGIEVGSEEGFDLLVYFADPALLEEFYVEIVEPNLRSRFMVRSWVGAADCVQVAGEMGGYVSLAHPFAFGRKSLVYQERQRGRTFVKNILDGVDAIELYNGGIQRQANVKAKEYADTSPKRLTVGSDSHRLATIGSCGVYLYTAEGNSSATLFERLAKSDELTFELCDTAVTLPTLGIIALKHTQHFVTSSKGRKRT
jgi:predicted metal-dependent phosphoesterase TrpH